MGSCQSGSRPQSPKKPAGNPNADLVEAANDGNYNRCCHLLKTNTDPGKLVNKANPKGNTPLHYAAMRGDTKLSALFLENGALPNRFNSKGWTALHFAAHGGHKQVCELLLECGADAAATQRTQTAGPNPATVARKAGNMAIVELLEHHMRKASGAGGEECIPLWKAAERGAADLCRKLIATGASPNSASKKGMVPLHFAAMGGHTRTCFVLLEGNADVRKTNARGWSALHFAANANAMETCSVLLDHKANPLNPAAKTQDGKTAADLAINKDLKVILQEAASVVGKKGVAKPLWKAAHDADMELCRRMIKAGSDVNEPNGKGNTALHYAAMTGKVDLCLFLIDCGASVDKKNAKGHTPRDFAEKSGKRAMIDLFVDFVGHKPVAHVPPPSSSLGPTAEAVDATAAMSIAPLGINGPEAPPPDGAEAVDAAAAMGIAPLGIN